MSKELKSSVSDDRDVIEGILNGSDDTLNRIYHSYFPMVLQLVITNNGTDDDAKDIFQEAVIVLYNKVKTGNFELSSKLKTFLYSVCRRLWLKKLSRQKNTADIRDFEEILPVEDDMTQHELKDRQFKQMEKALGSLGEPCKTIIEDFYLNNRSMQDICEKFGYTNADNAKTQKYKCLQRLKKIFFGQEG